MINPNPNKRIAREIELSENRCLHCGKRLNPKDFLFCSITCRTLNDTLLDNRTKNHECIDCGVKLTEKNIGDYWNERASCLECHNHRIEKITFINKRIDNLTSRGLFNPITSEEFKKISEEAEDDGR